MRIAAIVCCSALMTLTGCTKFTGEWIEQGKMTRDGYVESPGPRRAALKFDPVCNVRAGAFVDSAGVVDQQAVTYDTYITMQHGDVAQFGSVIAKRDGDKLITYVGAEEATHFVRHRGTSVFPPRLFARSNETEP